MIEGVGLASHATSPSAVATAIARSARKTSEAVRRKLAWVRKRSSTEGASTAGTAVTMASGAARINRDATSPHPSRPMRPGIEGTTIRRIPAAAA